MSTNKLTSEERQRVLDAAVSLEEMQTMQLPQSLLALKENPPSGAWIFGLESFQHADDFTQWAGMEGRESMPVSELINHAMHPFLRTWVIFRTQQISNSVKHRWCLFLGAELIETLRPSVAETFYRQCEYILKGKADYLGQTISLGNLTHIQRHAQSMYATSLQFGSPLEIQLAEVMRTDVTGSATAVFETTATAFESVKPSTNGYEKAIQVILSSLN